MQNFSFLPRLDVAEKFVVRWHSGGGPDQFLGSALVKLNNTRNFNLVKMTEFQGPKEPNTSERQMGLYLDNKPHFWMLLSKVYCGDDF